MKSKAHTRIQALRKLIHHHDVLYYQQARPEISDYAYDQLKSELISLEKETSEQTLLFSPSQTVDDDGI